MALWADLAIFGLMKMGLDIGECDRLAQTRRKQIRTSEKLESPFDGKVERIHDDGDLFVAVAYVDWLVGKWSRARSNEALRGKA